MSRPFSPHDPSPHDDSWETDAVWNLLDQAPPAAAGPRFSDNVTRAARLSEPATPWWKKGLPIAGLATTAAAIVFALTTFESPAPVLESVRQETVAPELLAEIQDVADAETLSIAVDHMDEFSDYELVSLIGL